MPQFLCAFHTEKNNAFNRIEALKGRLRPLSSSSIGGTKCTVSIDGLRLTQSPGKQSLIFTLSG
jgi:hypothetical protein